MFGKSATDLTSRNIWRTSSAGNRSTSSMITSNRLSCARRSAASSSRSCDRLLSLPARFPTALIAAPATSFTSDPPGTNPRPATTRSREECDAARNPAEPLAHFRGELFVEAGGQFGKESLDEILLPGEPPGVKSDRKNLAARGVALLQSIQGFYDHVNSGRLAAAPGAVDRKNDTFCWCQIGDAARE